MSEQRLIDKDALIAFIKSNGYVYANSLETFPEIDAEPVVHGEWLPQEKSCLGKNWFIYSCSICESGAPEEGTCKTPYCPNCGAKMDGKRKESEVHNGES